LVKALGQELAAWAPSAMTAEYRVAKRPVAVLVDYNQNAWADAASVLSVRPAAAVSTPVTWVEVERGIRIEDFTLKNVPARVRSSEISGSHCCGEVGAFDPGRFV
jgi:bifunctional non-homologous end joining protein LigD